jgi:hypothetical protein
VSALNSKSFTVSKGRTFAVSTPEGPFVAYEGETVLIVRARSYEEGVRKFIEAFEALNKPERIAGE